MRVARRKRRRGKRVVQDRTYTGYHRFAGDPLEIAYALHGTNKDVAERKLREIVENEEKRRQGMVVPPKLLESATRPLADHLREFVADHRTRGQNRQYLQHLDNRNERLMKDCGWQFVRDVTAESFITWRTAQTKNAPKTKNDYLAAAVGFMRWLVLCDRININPLAGVKRVEQRGKQTFERRALTPSVLSCLMFRIADEPAVRRGSPGNQQGGTDA